MKCIGKGSLSNLLVSRTKKAVWLREIIVTCLLLMAANGSDGSDSNGNSSGIVMVLNGNSHSPLKPIMTVYKMACSMS